MGKFETSKDKFDLLKNGTKWWVISTAGVADAWSCHHFINEVTTYLPNSNTGVQNYLDRVILQKVRTLLKHVAILNVEFVC